MLVRVSRRKTICEAECPLEDFLDIVFGSKDRGSFDLKPSAYLVAAEQVTRTKAEHMAGSMLDPPRDQAAINLDGFGAVVTTPGACPHFSFTRDAHREAQFESEGAVRAAAEAIFAERLNRAILTQRRVIGAYVQARIDANDAEWASALGAMSEATANRWRSYAKVGSEATT